jgi:hypothetical protein
MTLFAQLPCLSASLCEINQQKRLPANLQALNLLVRNWLKQTGKVICFPRGCLIDMAFLTEQRFNIYLSVPE